MSLDRSLKSASSLVRHRNVLTRAERMERMKDEDKWTEGRAILGLPKVGNRKQAEAKAAKTEAAGDAAPAAGGKAAPAAKAAAPAAGAKAAAAPAAAAAKKK